MFDAIIFDFDGVIADTEPLHCAAFVKILAPYGIDLNYATYLKRYVGYDDRDMFRAIFADNAIDLNSDLLKNLIAHKADIFAKIVSKGVVPCEGIIDLIQSVSKHYRLAICSGALKRDIDLILSAIGDGVLEKEIEGGAGGGVGGGVGSLFDVIITAEDVQRSKPDSECYRLAVDALDLTSEQCIAVEDTIAGIESAQGAGLRVLGVATTYDIDQLSLADHVVSSLVNVSLNDLRQWF